MLALRHRARWLAASAVLVVVVVWGSLQTTVEVPVPGGFDKFEHLGTYALLMVWFTGMFVRDRYGLIAMALVALGLSLEAGQYLMAAGRMADPYDVAANTLGVGLGLALALRTTGGWTPRVETWLGRN